jgi:hypothetical protein
MSGGAAGTGQAGGGAAAGSNGAGGTPSIGGVSGSAGSTGGTPAAAGTSGAAGASGAAGGTAGVAGGAGSSGAPGTAAVATELSAGPYACTEYLGAYLSMEWWNLGFLQDASKDGIDQKTWQLKWHHHGHVLSWADPNSPFWSDTGDPLNDSSGAPIDNPCMTDEHAPERVVMVTLSWEILDEQGWIDALEGDVATIKMKYPSVKWIDLMPMTRCPGDTHCNPNANYGPGADTDVSRQDCYVAPYVDSALAKVVANHPGSVGLGPVLSATMCQVPPNGAHLSNADNMKVAQEISDFYKTLP